MHVSLTFEHITVLHFNAQVWRLRHPCFNNNMSTAAVFLDIERVFDTKWHCDLLYKLSELEFLRSLTKPIAYFLTDRKFKISVEGELFTGRNIAALVHQGSVLAPVLYSLHVYKRWPRGIWKSSCSVFMRQRNALVVFSANCHAASLQWIHGVSAGT
jgi:hypothetical protein